MTATRNAQTNAAVARPGMLSAFKALTFVNVLLIAVQAVLAGQWLVGHKGVIKAHEGIGLTIFFLAILQLVCAFLAGVDGRARAAALGSSAGFLVLVTVQVGLGFAGFDRPNQAQALHIALGVLLFGMATSNISIALRAGRGDYSR
jgi:hypothetical protein